MALSQLLQPKLSFRFNRNGFPRTKRCLSSLPSYAENDRPSQLKKPGMAKEQRIEAVESFVKKYMKTNPGVLPKASHIRNEVGGSWYTVKEILHHVKEKMGTLQPENSHNVNSSTPAQDSAASNECNNEPHADLGLHRYIEEENVRPALPNGHGDLSSAPVVGTTGPGVTGLQDNSISCELQAASIVWMEESVTNSHAREKDTSANVTPLISGNCSESSTQLSAISGQQVNKDLSCSILLQLGSENSDSPSNGSLKRVSGLAELFKNTDDEAVAEVNEGQRQSEVAQSGVLGFETGRNSQVNKLSYPYVFFPGESPSMLQDAGLKSAFAGYENRPLENEMTTSSETPNLISEMPEVFAGGKKISRLEDTKTINNEGSEMTKNMKNEKFTQRYFGHLEEHKEKEGAKSFEIKDLINCIKGLPPQRPTITSSQENTHGKSGESLKNSQIRGSELVSDLLSFDKKERKISSDGHSVRGKWENDALLEILPTKLDIEDDDASGELAVPDSTVARGSTQVPFLTEKKYPYEIQGNSFRVKESDQNKVIVKFLRRTTLKSDLFDAFKDCGAISKVEIPYVEGSRFQVAYIYFKKREGLWKALGKTDPIVKGANVIVQAAGSVKDASKPISIPSLIGDPDVPASLVKNPTQTVMIKPLTHDISSSHIEAALAFFGSNVTGFFLGSSNSVAYVEFATEEGKEKALAKHFIDVLGKRLLISRIDVPRTTVVRISHPYTLKIGEVVKLCNSIGKVRAILTRYEGILDVHYRLAEWPNMLKILNRLNGTSIDGQWLLAQPASVFPPDVLRALWDQPEGRRYIKTTMEKLLQKLGENVVQKDEFTHLVDKFYGDQ